jgi:hypothetical protein
MIAVSTEKTPELPSRLHVFDASSLELMKSIPTVTSFKHLAICPDCSMVACSNDDELVVLDLKTDCVTHIARMRKFRVQNLGLRFPNENEIVVYTDIDVYSVEVKTKTVRELLNFYGLCEYVYGLSSDGSTAFVKKRNGRFCLVNTFTGDVMVTFALCLLSHIESVSFSDNDLIICLNTKSGFCILSSTGTIISVHLWEEKFRSVCLNEDGSQMTIREMRYVRVMDTHDLSMVKELRLDDRHWNPRVIVSNGRIVFVSQNGLECVEDDDVKVLLPASEGSVLSLTRSTNSMILM